MSIAKAGKAHPFAAVILAGGSGTRFWPRSRRARAKQVLQLDGERTMIQQTLARLEDVVPEHDEWVITNDVLFDTIAGQLPDVPREHILREPEARNTAPACALAAFLMERESPDTVIGVFPSDHTIGNVARFHMILASQHQARCFRRQDGCAGRAAHACGNWLWLHRAWARR